MTMPFDPTDLAGWLGSARQRATTDVPFSSPDDWTPAPDTTTKTRKKKKPPTLTIPETLDGAQIGDFLLTLGMKKPRKMKRLLRGLEWLDTEGQKAGVW